MGGFALGAWYRTARAADDRLALRGALCVGLACVLLALASTGRALVHGDGDVLSWEWSGESALYPDYRRFTAARDQRSVVEFLADERSGDEQQRGDQGCRPHPRAADTTAAHRPLMMAKPKAGRPPGRARSRRR